MSSRTRGAWEMRHRAGEGTSKSDGPCMQVAEDSSSRQYSTFPAVRLKDIVYYIENILQ